jgi:hypothetical protein
MKVEVRENATSPWIHHRADLWRFHDLFRVLGDSPGLISDGAATALVFRITSRRFVPVRHRRRRPVMLRSRRSRGLVWAQGRSVMLRNVCAAIGLSLHALPSVMTPPSSLRISTLP